MVLVKQSVTPPAWLVLQSRRIVVLGVKLDPFVDTLPSYPEHARDISGGTTMIELQDSKGPLKHADILGLRKLTPQTPPLPGGQVEPAHGLLLHQRGCLGANGVSNQFWGVA